MTPHDVAEQLGVRTRNRDKIRCPDHVDKTPSLHLYEDSWYCFSCGKSGDAYDLLELHGADVPDRPRSGRSAATKGMGRWKVEQTAHHAAQRLSVWFFPELQATMERVGLDWTAQALYWSDEFQDLWHELREVTPYEGEQLVRDLRYRCAKALDQWGRFALDGGVQRPTVQPKAQRHGGSRRGGLRERRAARQDVRPSRVEPPEEQHEEDVPSVEAPARLLRRRVRSRGHGLGA